MTDLVIDKAWSDISPGDFMRWATPRFIKYGRVIKRDGNGMTLQFIEDANVRVIPQAKWYFCQAKMYGPDAEEHLVCIDYSEWFNGPPVEPFVPPSYDDSVTVNDACEILRMDPKQLRRHIRRGRIEAHKDLEGRWMIDRDMLMTKAARYGWI